MSKRDYSQYQVSSEYAGCLEQAFGLGGGSTTGTASGGVELPPRTVDLGGILGAKGNTPLGTSNLGLISEDTVHLSVWADWGVERESLFQRLHKCQVEAKGKAEELEDDSPDELDFDPAKIEYFDDPASSGWGDDEHYIEGHGGSWFEFGGQLWRVKAYGVGGKEGRSYYPYVIYAGGVLIGFRRDKHETVSNMWLELGSIPLAQYGGLKGVWHKLLEMFKAEGISVERDIVSRVDIYSDVPEVDISEYYDRFFGNRRVCRARRIGSYEEEMNVSMYMMGMRKTGFSIGTNIKLRCYDKIYELSKDPVKWGVFSEKYGVLPEVLTRIEYQLRRVALKEFLYEGPTRLGISSEGLKRIEGVSTYLEARDQLWKYLTAEWFRLTESDVDVKNNHQTLAETWSVWKRVQASVFEVISGAVRFCRVPKFDMEALYRQALGCLCKMTIFENRGCELDTASSVLKYFCDKVREHGSEEFWQVMDRHYKEVHRLVGFSPA